MTLSIIKKNRPISIIIKDHVIRYVVNKSSGSLEVREYGERYIQSGMIYEGKINNFESLQLILDECVREWGLKKRDVKFIVPDPFIIVRQVDIPDDLQNDEIKGHLFMEIGTSIHLPFEDPVFDFVPLGEIEGKKKILLFAAPRSIVDEYERLLEAVDLKPVVADISPLSVYRLYYKLNQSSAEDHLLLIQFNATMVNVCIFHDDKPVFIRHLTMELNKWLPSRDRGQLQWTGEQEELIDELEQMYMEFDRIINFYNSSLTRGEAAITKILVNGDHPKFANIIEVIKERFEIPVDVIDQEKVSANNKQDVSRHFYLALGLALKEV